MNKGEQNDAIKKHLLEQLQIISFFYGFQINNNKTYSNLFPVKKEEKEI